MLAAWAVPEVPEASEHLVALAVQASSKAELAAQEFVTEGRAAWAAQEMLAAWEVPEVLAAPKAQAVSVLQVALVVQESLKAVRAVRADLEVQSVLGVPGVWLAWALQVAPAEAAL